MAKLYVIVLIRINTISGACFSTGQHEPGPMLTVTLDMEQHDCPLTQTTLEYDVAFTTPHWDFSRSADEWTLRISAVAPDVETLEQGLRRLRDDDAMNEFSLQVKQGNRALLRTVFEGTDAMEITTKHGGFVAAPFRNTGGSEQWTLGFDEPEAADATLGDLDRNHEFTVQGRRRLDLAAFFEVLHHHDASATLLNACRQLTLTERDVLATAYENGYFDTPRDESLASLSDRLDVSDVAISKTLRRAERKLLGPTLTALEKLDSDG